MVQSRKNNSSRIRFTLIILLVISASCVSACSAAPGTLGRRVCWESTPISQHHNRSAYRADYEPSEAVRELVADDTVPQPTGSRHRYDWRN